MSPLFLLVSLLALTAVNAFAVSPETLCRQPIERSNGLAFPLPKFDLSQVFDHVLHCSWVLQQPNGTMGGRLISDAQHRDHCLRIANAGRSALEALKAPVASPTCSALFPAQPQLEGLGWGPFSRSNRRLQDFWGDLGDVNSYVGSSAEQYVGAYWGDNVERNLVGSSRDYLGLMGGSQQPGNAAGESSWPDFSPSWPFVQGSQPPDGTPCASPTAFSRAAGANHERIVFCAATDPAALTPEERAYEAKWYNSTDVADQYAVALSCNASLTGIRGYGVPFNANSSLQVSVADATTQTAPLGGASADWVSGVYS